MILFKIEHKRMILDGTKTQTRRKGSRRWKAGSIHKCYTRPAWVGGEPFASVRIMAVRRERLGAVTDSDARAEGYRNVVDYLEAYRRIYKVKDMVAELDTEVWVVDFEKVEADA